MDVLEQMAVLETLRKGVEEAYQRARRAVFDEMVGAGVDRARVRVAGVEVATAQLRAEAVGVEDEDAYEDWCVGAGLAREERVVDFERLPADVREALADEVEERWPQHVRTRLALPDPRKLARRGPGGRAVTEDGEAVPGLRANVPSYVSLRDVADGRRAMNHAYVGGLLTRPMLAEVAAEALAAGEAV